MAVLLIVRTTGASAHRFPTLSSARRPLSIHGDDRLWDIPGALLATFPLQGAFPRGRFACRSFRSSAAADRGATDYHRNHVFFTATPAHCVSLAVGAGGRDLRGTDLWLRHRASSYHCVLLRGLWRHIHVSYHRLLL